ncbi:MAG: OmpH family outer membrane protein [Alphaproteobacteria bacterium]|nr:OmpH family outer membrane protein [Alphaproteobacteria bacterium]
MKKTLVVVAVLALVALGLGIACCAKCCGSKIAVVDLPAIVGNSAQVQALQAEQNAKGQELGQWLQNAQNEVNAQSDSKKKEALLQQYNAAFAQKREELAQQYAQKLQAVDANITSTITEIAKKMGYKMVLAKGVTIYGGDDITEEVKKAIK